MYHIGLSKMVRNLEKTLKDSKSECTNNIEEKSSQHDNVTDSEKTGNLNTR